MFSRSALVFVAVAFLEFVVFSLAATRVNVLLLIVVVGALSAAGVTYLFRQTAGMVRQSIEDLATATPGVGRDLGDRGLQVLGGLLLVFPGLVTGALGGLLLVSPVRAAVRPAIGSRLARLFPAELSASFADVNRVFRRRDVVDVDSVRKDPDGSPSNPSTPPELH